jgi:hypothetical protein
MSAPPAQPWLLKHWDSRQPWVYQVSAVISLVGCVVVVSLSLPRLGAVGWIAAPLALIFFVGIAVYQLLSYRVTLGRDKKGRLLLHKQRYLAFIPLRSATVGLASYDAVRTDWAGPSGSLLMRTVTDDERVDVYLLELYRQRDGDTLRIYRGPNQKAMQELADVLREHGGLTLTRK